MNIIYIDWPCFGRQNAINTLEEMGHQVVLFSHTDYEELESPSYRNAFYEMVEEKSIQLCFSYNYYPLIAKCCKEKEIKYISLVYDSPYTHLYSYTVIYPTNYIFVFDKLWVQEFQKAGIKTVHYMVLPTNADHIQQLKQQSYDTKRLSADVSFVGALYDEQHNLFERIYGKDEYLDGFLNGIIDAQRKVWGLNFIEEMLTPQIMECLQKIDAYHPNAESVLEPSYVYANYYINRKITQLERKEYLSAIGERFGLKLFTLDDKVHMTGVSNMGACDYVSEMPLVFHDSKINLNITLRSIKSGIPLRCMDIFGAGGFLLTNYQADMAEAFVAGEDFVYYEDKEDMLALIEYYLSHEKERQEIAQNAYRKVKENYGFRQCFSEMFKYV